MTVAAGSRYGLEIKVTGATDVEFWPDDTPGASHTPDLPAGDLDWSYLLESDGGGAGDDSHLTLGMHICQTDPLS